MYSARHRRHRCSCVAFMMRHNYRRVAMGVEFMATVCVCDRVPRIRRHSANCISACLCWLGQMESRIVLNKRQHTNCVVTNNTKPVECSDSPHPENRSSYCHTDTNTHTQRANDGITRLNNDGVGGEFRSTQIGRNYSNV